MTAQRVAAGRRIAAVWCAADPIVLEASPARLRRALLGRRVLRVGRHGKHFWLELDRRPWLLVHFGMSGGLYTPGRGVRLRSSGSRDWRVGWPPRFTKLRLTFDDGGELAIADARRLGRIRLRDDPRREPPLSALGFDALDELPPPARFRALLAPRAAPLKAVLLDQSFAAGVGNWVADEVLYQARIAPRRLARSLSAAEAGRLRGALRRVLTTAVRAEPTATATRAAGSSTGGGTAAPSRVVVSRSATRRSPAEQPPGCQPARSRPPGGTENALAGLCRIPA